ncbi:MAG: hypothetical protein IIC93_06070, partial [Chloroflexi bacterium]|nr:hypothetical protein [Chloroflexota bacterium]
MPEGDGLIIGGQHDAARFNTTVETLGLSARTLNCLKRAGINRVGEVLAMPKRDLLRIRNFGQKSLDELYERLGEEGFLDEEDDSENPENPESPASPENSGDDTPQTDTAGSEEATPEAVSEAVAEGLTEPKAEAEPEAEAKE